MPPAESKLRLKRRAPAIPLCSKQSETNFRWKHLSIISEILGIDSATMVKNMGIAATEFVFFKVAK